MFKWLLKMKLDRLGYKWVNVSEYALLDYRNQVRGNKNEDTWTLERKLNRNFYMGTLDLEKSNVNYLHIRFGALTIIYYKSENTIVGITNHKGNKYVAEVDKDLKNKLNKLYELK